MPSQRDHLPHIWTESQLRTEAQVALDEFAERRLAEPEGTYQKHVKASRAAIRRLFVKLSSVDPKNPSPQVVREIIRDDALFSALRYVAGPPVSEDDLGVLVTRRVEGVSRRELANNDRLPLDVLALICKLSDPYRFPWVKEGRPPATGELLRAIEKTSLLQATQALQTERRGYGKAVEQRLEQRLASLGFKKIVGGKRRKQAEAPPAYPPKGRVSQPTHHPVYPHFYGECIVYKRKVDLFIALRNGRMVALEAKDSSSALNSKKRLLNDTAAKAGQYETAAGKNIINVALLSGVFDVPDLMAAQDAGLYLVWSHSMDMFIEWIQLQQ